MVNFEFSPTILRYVRDQDKMRRAMENLHKQYTDQIKAGIPLYYINNHLVVSFPWHTIELCERFIYAGQERHDIDTYRFF